MSMKKLLATLILLFCFALNAQSDVGYTPAVMKADKTFVLPKIKIYGQIKQEDARQFHILKEEAKENAHLAGINMMEQLPLLVELDSMGGSVSAALLIGSEIREANPFSVNVQDGASCVSACVLILAGGVGRLVHGRVGIHRPYIDEDKSYTVAGQKQSYSNIERKVKDYLSSVNVPTTLYDVMFRIPPEKVRYLSVAELQDFNLNEDDPYYKEAQDAKMANKLGLTKREYLKRKSECSHASNLQQYASCLAKISTGVTEQLP